MSPIKWKQEMNTGVREINAQHKELIALCNEVLAAQRRGADKQVVADLLGRLIAYTRYHCAVEQEMGGPGNGGAELPEKVARLCAGNGRGPASISAEALQEMQDLFLQHVLTWEPVA